MAYERCCSLLSIHFVRDVRIIYCGERGLYRLFLDGDALRDVDVSGVGVRRETIYNHLRRSVKLVDVEIIRAGRNRGTEYCQYCDYFFIFAHVIRILWCN